MKLQSLKHKILLPVIGTVMVVVILLSWLSFTSLRDCRFQKATARNIRSRLHCQNWPPARQRRERFFLP